MYFSVVQDYQGVWSVGSFFGKTAKQEKEFALTVSKKCVLVTKDIAAAHRKAADCRKENAHA